MTRTANLTKQTATFTTPRSALRDLRTGILELDKFENVRFADPMFCEIAGIETWQGLKLRDLFADERTYKAMSVRLKRRISEGVGEEYSAEISRPSDGKAVAINITGLPETGPNGDIVGALALVRDCTLERVDKAIQGHINEEHDTHKMLERIAEELATVLPCDYFSVAIYSGDERHVCELFRRTNLNLPTWPVRWYELQPIARRMIEGRSSLFIDDFVELLKQPEWAEAAKAPGSKEFLASGLRSCLWYPLVQEGRVRAAITLYSHRIAAYGPRDRDDIEKLPIGRALTTVLSNLSRNDLQFRLSLVRDIASSEISLRTVAQLLTQRVKEHYGWSNVSLFRVDDNRECFVLLDQDPKQGDYAYEEGHTQPLDKGILGYVRRTRQAKNVGNIEADKEVGHLYERAMAAKPKSELAIPIVVDDRVCAILNSEDVRENAYSAEEQQALELIFGEVAGLYKRLEAHETLKAIQDSASDGIVRTDENGLIKQINPAGVALLGGSVSDLQGRAMATLFEDKELARACCTSERIAPSEVRLKRDDGKTVTVLLSSSPLPDHIGGRVHMFSDLSLRKRIEHLESMGRIYQELGAQAQPALTLCFGWLRRLLPRVDPKAKETLDKTVRQLRKVRLTYDRLSLAERPEGSLPFNPVLISVPRIVQLVVDDFPKVEAKYVETRFDGSSAMIRCDIFQAMFCVRSVLAYLLRFVPEDGKVEICTKSDPDVIRLQMRGRTPRFPDEKAGGADENIAALAHSKFELAISSETMASLMRANGGRLEGPTRNEEYESFELVFPLPTQGG